MPATISITRSPNWVDVLRSYNLLIDGEVRGSVRRGQTTAVVVEPGRHDVRLTVDWCGSSTVEVDLGDGDRAYFNCVPNVPLLLWPLYVTVRRNQWIELQLMRIEPGE